LFAHVELQPVVSHVAVACGGALHEVPHTRQFEVVVMSVSQPLSTLPG